LHTGGYVMVCKGVAANAGVSPSWVRRSARGGTLPRLNGRGVVPRYTYRRLTKLPSTADELSRHTVLNLPGMLHGLSVEHMVMGPGAVAPISVEDEAGILIFTLAGRGVMALDGDRIEVSANDLVHIPAGVPYGMQTLGGTDWVYVAIQAPAV